MADKKSAQDDAKEMKAKYVQGVNINDLAEAYGHSEVDVERVVVTPDETVNKEPVYQADLDAAESKKGK